MAGLDSRGQCTVEVSLVTLLFFLVAFLWLEDFSDRTRGVLERAQLSGGRR